MSRKGKLIVSLEVKCGGHSIHDIFRTNTQHLSTISPSRVKHFEIHEGEKGEIGSVASWKYYEGNTHFSPLFLPIFIASIFYI